MLEIDSIESLRAVVSARPDPVGVVPLTFDLHEGHLSLLRHARAQNATVVASLLASVGSSASAGHPARYPRDAAHDRAQAREAGVDLLVNAGPFPPQLGIKVVVPGLSDRWYGLIRPGYFEDAATLLLKLAIAARAARVYLGEKDPQLIAVMREVAVSLLPGLRVIGCPVVRQDDGLPWSSSYARLNPQERIDATAVSRALTRAQSLFAAGERNTSALQAAMLIELAGSRLLIEYAAVVDPGSLQPLPRVDRSAVALVSVCIGSVRVTDSVLLGHPAQGNVRNRALE
jgi:pantoate--beta-alanine ligase